MARRTASLLGAPPALALAALVALLALACACGDAEPEAARGEAAPPFTVRGRWDDPRRLRVAVESEGAPVDAAVFERAVARAMQSWSETGVVGFATDAGAADVTLGWRRGRHGACEPFGATSAVAHSGPVERGTWVHFDAARTWSEDGGGAHSIYHTALHELGHVLGLGHSEAADSAMSTRAELPDRPGPGDVAGLQSLYGGGRDAPGDLHVLDASGKVLAALRGVAPKDRSGHAVFDTDGDGDSEVLIWRTDAAGHGALMVLHFARGPRLLRTAGPFFGVCAARERLQFAVAAGRRLLGLAPAAGRLPADGVRWLCFDDHGAPAALDAPVPAGVAASVPTAGDLDGDGTVEAIAAVGG